jgi:hypothetical protein
MYYVYALIDVRTELPFYIGKGKEGNNRHLDHFCESIENTDNRQKVYKIQYLLLEFGDVPVLILDSGIKNEDSAYDLETFFIKKYGRINIDPGGILTNILIDKRPPNHTGRKQSLDHINKRMSSRKHTADTIGIKPCSPESNKKKGRSGIENGFYGKKHTEKNKNDHSMRMKGNKNNIKTYEFTDPKGISHIVDGFYAFCEDNHLVVPTLEKALKNGTAVYSGKCKGWKVRRLSK